MKKSEVAKYLPERNSDSDSTFDEPWQAQLFALLSVLSAADIIEPGDWSAAFGKELRRDHHKTTADGVGAYYDCALKLLERLLVERGVVSTTAIENRVDSWKSAYLNTPHGHPVCLSASTVGDSEKLGEIT